MALDKEETMAKVVDVLVDQLGVEKDKIAGDSEIMEDLGADSLDVVDVVQALEEEFTIKVPNSAIEGLKTVDDVVNFIINNA